jgi:uncharacterized protein YkwD
MNKVFKAFKHAFIPHKHNDYKPHFFREASIISITVVAIVILSISASTSLYIKNTNMTATVLPAVLVDLTNDARTSNSEKALTRNSVLDTAARLKAENMASLGYFAHTSPAGLTPWHWFDEAGYSFVYAGENLAIDFTESVDVEKAWLNSPTHKANILNSHFSEIGIATVDASYQGHPTTYVVQMFGSPAITRKEEPKVETNVVTEIKPKTEEIKVVKPQIENPIAIASTPSVKGAEVSPSRNLETITETKEFVAVKNTTTEEKPLIPKDQPVHYASWNEKLMFMLPSYADRIYHVIMWVVIVAMLSMTVIEFRRRHPKNIMYGVLTLVIMLCLIYINKAMFVTSFIS